MVQICYPIIFYTLLFTCIYCYEVPDHTKRHLEVLDNLKSLQTPTREVGYYALDNSRTRELQRKPKSLSTRGMKSEDAYIEKLILDSQKYYQFPDYIDSTGNDDNRRKSLYENKVYSQKNKPHGFPYFQTSRFDADTYSRRIYVNSQDRSNNNDMRTTPSDRHYDLFQDLTMKPDPFYISQDEGHSDQQKESYKMVDIEKMSKFQAKPILENSVPSHIDWGILFGAEETQDEQNYNKQTNPWANQGLKGILNKYSEPPSTELLLELLKTYRGVLDRYAYLRNVRDVNKQGREQTQAEKQRLPESKWNNVDNYFDETEINNIKHEKNVNEENFSQLAFNSKSISNKIPFNKIYGKAPLHRYRALTSENRDIKNKRSDHFKYQGNEIHMLSMKTSRKEPLKKSRSRAIESEIQDNYKVRKVYYSSEINIHNPDKQNHLLHNITREKNSRDTKPIQQSSREYVDKELLNFLEKRTHAKHVSNENRMSMTMQMKNESNHGEIVQKGKEHNMNMKMNGNHMDMDKMKRLMEGYKYHVMLDITSKLMFCWNVNYSNKTVSIRVTCQLSPDYWFGVGFSDYGEITNADMVVFWNDPVATHHLQDSYTNSNGILFSDLSQDYTLHKARTEDGLSILEYTRPFDTCDEQDYLLDKGTTHIVYFVSKGTPASCVGKDVRGMRHGFQRVQLLKPDVHLPPLPTDVWTFEITAPNVTVPGTETTYWWYITTLPKLDHKQHIVRYEGVIQKENEDIVHHIEVFHCVGRKHVKPYSGPKVPEGKMSPTSDLTRCRNVIGAWAMGAEPIIYPEEAGSPIGGTDFSPYVLLEVHYHNPHLKTGHVDRSGIRFYVTPTLRRYDMGIMELGLEYTDKMSIPPKQDKFTLTGYCIAECTQLALPKDGINIFASQLHTHLTGKRVWTKHIRDGQELPEVNRDNHYSPHFQEVRVMPRPVNILPGDALITECVDSTRLRSNMTYGGFSITEEMCVNYIHYYPKVNLEVCKSSISDNALQNFFYFMKRLEGVPIVPSKGIKYNYNIIPWFPLNVRLLDYVYQTSPISMQCNQSNGERFPGIWEGVESTKIQTPLKPVEKDCPV